MKGQRNKLASFIARPAPAKQPLSLEERAKRADEAMEGPTATPKSESTTGAQPTVDPGPTVRAQPTVGPTPTVGKPQVEPLVKPTADSLPTVGAAPAVRIAVEPKKGELRIPNHIVFNLLPRLPLAERAVYLELYAWTHGFGQPERRLSIAKLCKSLKIDYKRFMRIVAELAKNGLVEMDERVIGGPRDDRGTVFRVYEPLVLDAIGKTPRVGGVPTVGRAPTMKSKRENHVEKAPDADAPSGSASEGRQRKALDVYAVRERAARLLEVKRGELGFDLEKLRRAVAEAILASGDQASDETIVEATKGMVL